MRRREFLKLGGLATGTAIASACGVTPPRTLVVTPPRRFVPVNVAKDRIIRTVVGLRPFRPSGFVVRGEKVADKAVVHNYGHGGGGMTMSWGTSHLAVEQAMPPGGASVAVLGCGGVGLATARLLQRRGCSVTIYAKDEPPNTTSNIAGAQWSPAEVYDPDHVTPEFRAQFVRAAHLSHREYQNLVGDVYGIRWIENYIINRTPFVSERQGSSQGIDDLYPDARDLTPADHPFGKDMFVRRFTTMLIEPPVYLNAMIRDFFLAGGKLVIREFHDLRDVQASVPEPIVINCTGLGAGNLVGDTELMPIKGQLTVLLPQPEVDYIALFDDLYMFPRRDGVLLGGTHERGVWTMEPNLEAAEHVFTGHQQFFARMRA